MRRRAAGICYHHGTTEGVTDRLRFGNIEIRPAGGGPGCLMMILLSVGLSILGTIVLNLLR